MNGQACERLEREYGRAGRVSFRGSPLGPVASLSAPGGVAEVALLGAQTLVWRPAGGPGALFWPGVPPGGMGAGAEIHGGIPVCWPWFGRMGGDGARPHGSARYRAFRVDASYADDRRSGIALRLEAAEGEFAEFPHAFRLAVRVGVGDGLEVSLAAENTGGETFAVTAGFHPYLRVSDAGAVSLEGLEGAPYADWKAGMDGGVRDGLQAGPYRPAPGSRVFAEGRAACRVRDPGWGRSIALEAHGHTRWCVWRAGGGGGPRGNLRPGDERDFVCAEPVVFPRCDAVALEPGASMSMGLSLRVEPCPEAVP